MTRYADLNQINYIQIDHTSRCNLLCQQCARVHNGKLNPSLPQDELQLEDYVRIFSNNLPNLKEIFFCGNFGDASVSQSFLPALKYLRATRPNLVLKLSTNGSARQKSWWKELAAILDKPRDLVAFSIDGLESTNAIYRVNSKWENIMENASSFIEAGGRARWDFLVFAHNEHQVEEARSLAKKMGFIGFTVKRSNRFLKFTNSAVAAPKNVGYQGQAMQAIPEVIKEYGSLENYQQSTSIHCQFKNEKNGIFIDFQARLWPCTWMAAPIFQHDEMEQKPFVSDLIERYGIAFNSLKENSWDDILQHPWLSEELVKSWSAGETRSPICTRNCGEKIRFSSENPENRTMEKWNQSKEQATISETSFLPSSETVQFPT